MLSPQQKSLHCGLLLIACLLAIQWPLASLIFFNVATTTYYVCAIAFRIWLVALGSRDGVDAPAPARTPNRALPVITILLPLFRDAKALPMLAHAIDALDYPTYKKDVKLLLEERDRETIFEAYRLRLDKKFHIIIVPAQAPRTKPKACNVGLELARGELIVIYDAEDCPEHDQLRKATAAFAGRDDSLACVQARLNYYNRNDNWLTRLFTLEYSLWFDWLLPALQKMGAPIPLGGTSNFFRTSILKKAGGWDPYNVTEDADLGLRLSSLGYRVELIASTTFEEANCDISNWVRQRSRWLKGYLQTWLVHMRHPQRIIATTGWRGFFAVQLFVAGNLFSAIINPFMWAIFIVWLVWRPPIFEQLFPAPIFQLNMFALVFGNLFFIFLLMIGPLKRGWSDLSLYGLTAPAYWLLTSFAAYKALWQAVRRPHYWEKTEHVISSAARQKRSEALRSHFANGQD
jgi:cellulose synthase/poly-beta-1,6-N-acetylglucosamine synthase-like glycosyltransferase